MQKYELYNTKSLTTLILLYLLLASKLGASHQNEKLDDIIDKPVERKIDVNYHDDKYGKTFVYEYRLQQEQNITTINKTPLLNNGNNDAFEDFIRISMFPY